MVEMRNTCNILVGETEKKRPLGRPRRRRKDSIGIDLRKIRWKGVDRTRMTQDRDQWRTAVNTVMNIRVS
jgi:hypothetical protein